MDRILENIKRIIAESIKEHLTDVSVNELEGNGSLYYMNGQNGTSFDWHVNDRLSSFMSFYDDKVWSPSTFTGHTAKRWSIRRKYP